MLDMEEDLF